MNSQKIALVAILSAGFLFSLPPIVVKLLYQSFDPIPVAFIRFLIAFVAIIPIVLVSKKASDLYKNFKITFLIGTLSTLNILFFSLGIARTTATTSGILYTAVPLMVAFFSRILLKESLTKAKALGILLGLGGVSLIVLLPFLKGGNFSGGDFFGNILIFAGTITWAMYSIGSRYLISRHKISPLNLTAMSFLPSLIVFFPLAFLTSDKDFITKIFSPFNFWLFILLGLVITVGSYVMLQWAIKHSSATTASLNQYLQPVFTISLAAIILGERITLEFIIGATLVILGVFIATNATSSLRR